MSMETVTITRGAWSGADHTELSLRQAYIRAMPHTHRKMMLRHAEGPLDIITGERTFRTRAVLVTKHLLKFDRMVRPKQTIPTEQGRTIIATMLAMEAEKMLEYLEP